MCDGQGRNEIRWRLGEEAGLAPRVRTLGLTEANALNWRKTCDNVGIFVARGIVLPFLPRYAPGGGSLSVTGTVVCRLHLEKSYNRFQTGRTSFPVEKVHTNEWNNRFIPAAGKDSKDVLGRSCPPVRNCLSASVKTVSPVVKARIITWSTLLEDLRVFEGPFWSYLEVFL